MASTWSWCSALIVSTSAPMPRHRARTASTAAGSVPSGGVRMHQRPWNRVAKPASGPEYSVPAIGWPGTRATPSGRCGLRPPPPRRPSPSRHPTRSRRASDAAPSRPPRPRWRRPARTGSRGRHRAAPSRRVARDHVGDAEFADPRRARPRRGRRPRSCGRGRSAARARAIEEPISPRPTMARRPTAGARPGRLRHAGPARSRRAPPGRPSLASAPATVTRRALGRP